MPQNWKEVGPVTVVLLLLVVIVAVAGGVIVVVEPSTLSFPEYLDKMQSFAIGLGILGVGRGIVAGARVVQLPPPAKPRASKPRAKPAARGGK